MGTRGIQIQILEDRCPALVNKLKRKFSFSHCGHGEKLENVKLMGLSSHRQRSLIFCFVCSAGGQVLPSLPWAFRAWASASISALVPAPWWARALMPVAAPACTWPPHTSKTWAPHTSPEGRSGGEEPAGCSSEKPIRGQKNHIRTMCELLFGVALLQQSQLQATQPALALPVLFGLFRTLTFVWYGVTGNQTPHAGFMNPNALP